MPHYPDDDALQKDSTDVLALWGNNRMLTGGSHWNNFSFRFSLAPDGLQGSPSEYEGLEIMRLRPYQLEEKGRVEGFVGIGDWVNNYPEVPEERLDVLDRTIRIRSMGLPGLYNNDALTRVLVADPADGRLFWRDVSTIGGGGGSGCNWAYISGANRMYTAFDPVGAGTCPQKDWLVGIGESVPKTKLDVYTERTTGGATGAIRGIMKANTDAAVQSGVVGSVSPEIGGNTVQTGIGIDGTATDVNKGYGVRGTVNLTLSGASTTDAFGTYGYANAADGSADYVCGARGEVTVTGTTVGRKVAGTYGLVKTPLTTGSVANSYGMFGWSDAYGNIANNFGGYGNSYANTGITLTNSYGLFGTSGGQGSITNSYGVYGAAGAGTNNFSVYGAFNGNGANDWTGFFNGRTFTPGGLWTMSDPEFKTNISLIEQNDQDPVHRMMQLNVHSYMFNVDTYPALGLPTGQHFGFLAPELAEQFPDMVTDAAFPAQYDSTGAQISPEVPFKAVNTTDLLPLAIAALQRQDARIAQLEAIVASCCSNGSDQRALSNGPSSSSALENDLRIITNPIADPTELRYTVAYEGRVRLEITDATGRTMLVQDEGTRTAGSYMYEWSTTLLAPGTYHCALYVNGERLVEKAVKLNNR